MSDTVMKRAYFMIAASLLLPGVLLGGPLHWTARLVKSTVVGTGHAVGTVARGAGRVVHHPKFYREVPNTD
jgi:hypothetical protein